MRAAVLLLFPALFIAMLAIDRAPGQNRALEVPGGGEAPPARRDSGAPPGTAAPPAVETGRTVENGTVQASPLDTIWMRDAKGNLVPVVGMPFEEFEQLLRSKKGLAPAAPPAYTLETISLAGKANPNSADLQLTATIRVRESGWIRVPLHLAGAVIRERMQHEGPGESFLSYDAETGGYVCWLSGNDARPHVITIALSLPISSAGEEQRLAMSLARATESSFRLVVASPAVETSLAAGEGIASSRSLESGSSEITVVGAAGEVQLTWRPRRSPTSDPPQLDVSGEITVRIHSEHRIATDARLRVRSYGPPLESFRVRLPPGMELISSTSGGYSVANVDSQSPASRSKNAPTAQQVIEVRPDKPAANMEVLIRAQREADAAGGAATWLSPAQFSVVGAVRQRGTIDFTMDGEWQLDWKEDKTVHRVELMPESAAARVMARYEYFRQPCGLAVKVSTRPARVSVEPIHRIYVEAERVRIESLLRYRFRGARADSLIFQMGDWAFDRLMPDTLLDFPLEGSEKGTVEVPFRPGASPPSDLELKLEAHRAFPRGDTRLAIEFPRPEADIVLPATVLVFAAENIELNPQYDEIQGLSAEALGSRAQEKDHPSLAFRELGAEESAFFVSHVRTLKRTTTTAAKCSVKIDRQQIQVEQRIEYRVSHEPQREFSLLAPREIVASDTLDVVVNGQSAPARQLPQIPVDDDRLVRLQVSAAQPLLGSFAMTIRYSLPLVWDRTAAASLSLPLIVPAPEEELYFSGQHVQFQLAEDTNIEPEQAENEEGLQPVAVRGSVNEYSWEDAACFSRWSLVPGPSATFSATRVLQMWVQTWLAPDVRQERVALRVMTAQDHVRVRLPLGVRSVQTTAVDSEKVEAGKGRLSRSSSRSGGEITIPVKKGGRECVVEIWYSTEPPSRSFGIGHGELETVRIPDAEAPRRTYWQLVTSPGERLISFPDDLSSEMAWSTDRFHMFRRPILDQRQLESWIKASRQDLLPHSAHEYLFGAVGQWPTLRVETARSSAIVGLASAAVLLIGLGLLHLPVLRRPETLLVGALAVAAAGVLWPDTAIIAAQAGALGLAILALLAMWSYLSTSQTGRDLRPISASASKALSAPSTHSSGSQRPLSSRVGTTHGAPLMEARP